MAIRLLDIKKLTLEGTLEVLMNKGIVVVRGVEATNKGDILVRLDPRAVPVTQVSLDTMRDANSTYAKPYWWVQDIPFNYFVTRDVYEFTEDYRTHNPKYKIGDIVKYSYMDGTAKEQWDTAIVERVMVDEGLMGNNKYYYGLSKVEYNLAEDKIYAI